MRFFRHRILCQLDSVSGNRNDRIEQGTLQHFDFDIVIFGGGIAGLWSLARLRRAGYRTLLLEDRALGGIQTIGSQGIIHGGTKYALTGRLTGSSEAIRAMPGIWRDCLAGSGEPDLSGTRVLADHQLLWSTGGLGSGLAGFFAGRVMQSRVRALPAGERPAPFDHPGFHGQVYRLDEPVLDVRSLVEVLVRRHGAACRAYRFDELQVEPGEPTVFRLGGSEYRAQRLVFAAGAGNQALLERWGRAAPAMQRRPLHMLLLRGRLPPLFAHCLGPSANPRLTVTSYPLNDGRQVWHLGGQIAEEGAGRERAAQLRAGRRELTELLPWLDQTGLEWSSWRVDRAEPRMPGGRRPDESFVAGDSGLVTVWPTKLAFAPKLANDLLALLRAEGMRPSGATEPVSIEVPIDVPGDLPRPPIAAPPWETNDGDENDWEVLEP